MTMYVSAKLGDEVSGMIQTILRKDSSKFRNKKELVLEEALRFYYQNREQKRWRKE